MLMNNGDLAELYILTNLTVTRALLNDYLNGKFQQKSCIFSIHYAGYQISIHMYRNTKTSFKNFHKFCSIKINLLNISIRFSI